VAAAAEKAVVPSTVFTNVFEQFLHMVEQVAKSCEVTWLDEPRLEARSTLTNPCIDHV
jgi:hypothetical protein